MNLEVLVDRVILGHLEVQVILVVPRLLFGQDLQIDPASLAHQESLAAPSILWNLADQQLLLALAALVVLLHLGHLLLRLILVFQKVLQVQGLPGVLDYLLVQANQVVQLVQEIQLHH